MIRVGILIIVDQSAPLSLEEESGPSIRATLPDEYEVVHYKMIQQDLKTIQEKLIQWTSHCDIIFTTGGIGPFPAEITPEATQEILDRPIPGISETIRHAASAESPSAVLSRGVAGIRDHTYIVNLPRDPAAIKSGIETVLPALYYGVVSGRPGLPE